MRLPAGDPAPVLLLHSPIPTLFLFVLQILFYFDIVFTTIFTIEIALKVTLPSAPLLSFPTGSAALSLTHTLLLSVTRSH